MSTSGRKRKQQLKPRQDIRSPVKRQSLDVKTDPLSASSYPLADYDCMDIKPDLTELQLQLAVTKEKETPTTTTTINTKTGVEDIKPDLDHQLSDSDDDGYSEINFGAASDVFCEDQADDYDPDWTAQPTRPRLIFKFNTPVAGQTALKKLACPTYYFNQLLGNRAEFFTQLAKGYNNVTNASAEELETFVGLCLLLSDIKLPQLLDYWSDNMYPGFVGFAAKMSKERFQQLLSSLSFENLIVGNNDTDCHAAGQAGKLISYYNARMSELYMCGQQLVLNEPIIHWKQQFCFQQDLPQKQRFNALLLHLLTEHNGLVLRILPELHQRQLARNSRQLVVQRNELALQLLHSRLMRGHSVYVCKYYGSYGLANELAKFGTYCSGLLDRNRYGNSKALVYQQLTANSIATRYAPTPLMMAKWRRRDKCVYFYSSDCLAIYAKELSMQKINARPKLIQELDFQLKSPQSMRQKLISYNPSCSGLERQQQLSIYMLNVFVYNAYVLYLTNAQPARTSSSSSNDSSKLKSYAEFRMAIIKSLLKEDNPTATAAATHVPDASVNAAVASPSSINNKKRLDHQSMRTTANRSGTAEGNSVEAKHELVLIQRNGKSLRKNCRHCNKGGMMQFTKYMCNLCPDSPGLCIYPCFRLWHEQQLNQ